MRPILGYLFGLAAWAVGQSAAWADVPRAYNFREDAEAADRINGAVLVAFVGEYCGYCEIALNEFLSPMNGNADYQEKVVMRRVIVSAGDDLIDFDGNRISSDDFASRYGNRMVPTVILLDGRGRVLAKPVVGLTTVDYYGYYLDQAIDTAVGKIRKTGKLVH